MREDGEARRRDVEWVLLMSNLTNDARTAYVGAGCAGWGGWCGVNGVVGDAP